MKEFNVENILWSDKFCAETFSLRLLPVLKATAIQQQKKSELYIDAVSEFNEFKPRL